MTDVKQILQNLGFTVRNDGYRYLRAKPIYRDSDNCNSLRINRKTGWFTDFSASISGNLELLVKITLGLKDIRDAKSWLANNEFSLTHDELNEKPIIEENKVYFDHQILDRLVKNHSYWESRNIKQEIVEKYNGGIALNGRMNGRYVFPVFDQQNRIIGFVGRDLSNKKYIKWKVIGNKQDFVWPLRNLDPYKPIVLVESPGCVLALDQVNVQSLCLFGTNLLDKILSYLVRINPKKIVISTNNEPDNDSIGNKSADVIQKRLLRFFDPQVVQIHLPIKKDIAEQTIEETLEWLNGIK